MIFRIRPATVADAAEAGRAGYAAWLKGIAPNISEEARARISEQTFVSFIRDLPEQIFVAEGEGLAAGIGATEKGGNHISDIWVAPEHEGKGIGSALVRALEERIAARGYDVASISALSANARALSLYRHLGYRLVRSGVEYDPSLDCDTETCFLEKVL